MEGRGLQSAADATAVQAVPNVILAAAAGAKPITGAERVRRRRMPAMIRSRS